ncbi:ferredoxin--NADP(+) reductase [Marinicauda salina]|uniref:ferredoxin--NADP(+) reductase n=1 Tax=Marinicauda salina TaxID=2135793 RepID=A0A2U2BXL8_9PROT|nr:ferredoxin--NADP reductase [Marinicauda salina]PWE18714.1 ferredoxin--NADP(+) reductase [Marinicauda salina]
MAAVTQQTVISVRHYTDRLFAFRVTRPASFRFRSGEFVMLGLEVDGKPLLRAYSMASPAWDDELEFFSIKVPDGPLTSRLQHIEPGDEILLGAKATGTLVLDALLPGDRLYLLSTGTGIAPFASIVRDPETYERYSRVILTHTCREAAELEYGRELVAAVKADPLVGELASEKLVYYPSVTREAFERTGRITKLIDEGTLFEEIGAPPFDPACDRVMICGSKAMLEDCRKRVEAAGLTEGSNSRPAEFVVEKAFVG